MLNFISYSDTIIPFALHISYLMTILLGTIAMVVLVILFADFAIDRLIRVNRTYISVIEYINNRKEYMEWKESKNRG